MNILKISASRAFVNFFNVTIRNFISESLRHETADTSSAGDVSLVHAQQCTTTFKYINLVARWLLISRWLLEIFTIKPHSLTWIPRNGYCSKCEHRPVWHRQAETTRRRYVPRDFRLSFVNPTVDGFARFRYPWQLTYVNMHSLKITWWCIRFSSDARILNAVHAHPSVCLYLCSTPPAQRGKLLVFCWCATLDYCNGSRLPER